MFAGYAVVRVGGCADVGEREVYFGRSEGHCGDDELLETVEGVRAFRPEFILLVFLVMNTTILCREKYTSEWDLITMKCHRSCQVRSWCLQWSALVMKYIPCVLEERTSHT
jgi:hypothetical protein